jgi:hypothetical protein
MNNERFSKKTLATHLYRQIKYLGEKYKFDPSNGYNQVKGRGGELRDELNRAYGEWNYACQLMDQFDLWDCVAEGEL